MKKGSPSNSLPKTFSFKFFPDRALRYYLRIAKLFRERPVREKFGLKVFGKGFGEEPFLRKVFPDKKYEFPYVYHVRDSRLFMIYISTATAHLSQRSGWSWFVPTYLE